MKFYDKMLYKCTELTQQPLEYFLEFYSVKYYLDNMKRLETTLPFVVADFYNDFFYQKYMKMLFEALTPAVWCAYMSDKSMNDKKAWQIADKLKLEFEKSFCQTDWSKLKAS